MADLEGPDDPITIARAAHLAGLQPKTLRDAAQQGRLQATMPGNEYLTTRRHLHRYLAGRKSGRVVPLPEGYQTPPGEKPIR
jgi:excisionase family DNA binding protein